MHDGCQLSTPPLTDQRSQVSFEESNDYSVQIRYNILHPFQQSAIFLFHLGNRGTQRSKLGSGTFLLAQTHFAPKPLGNSAKLQYVENWQSS
jgi:hypothetical protein